MKINAFAFVIMSLSLAPLTASATASLDADSGTTGVKFQNSTYTDVLSQAQKENKDVMVEFFSPT